MEAREAQGGSSGSGSRTPASMGLLRALLPRTHTVAAPTVVASTTKPPARQHAELGTINYVNLRGTHGDVDAALAAAKAENKPIFANFVEFPG